MSLNEAGRTGVKVNLTADGVFGIVTQDPESMLHSSGPDGLLLADGNTCFGVPFVVLFYFKHTTTYATQTTTSTPVSADAPFKFRVLGVKVRCISSDTRDVGPPHGSAKVQVQDGSSAGVWTALLPWTQGGEMDSGSARELNVLHQGPSTIAVNEGLRCQFETQENSIGRHPDVEYLVEVHGIRVS